MAHVTSDLHARDTFADVVYQAVTRFPDRNAFIDADRSLTYRDTAQGIAACLAFLRSSLSPGAGFAVLSDNRPEMFIALAAAALGSYRFTALHPERATADHAYALERSGAELLLFTRDFSARVEAGRPAWPTRLRYRTLEEVSAVGPDGPQRLARPSAIDPDDTFAVTFTGGTTGRPKGVCRSQRTHAVNALYSALEWEWPGEPRFLAATPMSHAAGLMVCPVLMRGGTIVIQRQFDVSSFVDAVERERINTTFVVPTMLYRLLDAEPRQDARLVGLQTVLYGAAPINTTRLQEAIDRLGPIFMQFYGQSEAPNLVSVLRKHEHLAGGQRLNSCGRPTGCTQVAVLDRTGGEVAPGIVGEICVRGEIVMDGYWQEPELTAAAVIDGWLHTGDLGSQDAEGYLTIVDRAKDMIISGGLNVYAREVEDVLDAHPAVRQSAVVGAPHRDWGEEVVAFVSTGQGEEPTAEELIAYVRRRKGSVHAPKRVMFVDSLPLTPLAKPDKTALRQLLLDNTLTGVSDGD